ncbi:MAG: phosphate acyltransferase PlsX [Candidatus Krumholzibacteria bacterium]|nr:phosphate acyltransferase PlsX [Candidatus Krumholzibacteria bacterium]
MAHVSRRPRIAVDAMGGDVGPAAVVPGVLAALHGGVDCDLVLYGQQARVAAELGGAGAEPGIEIIDCNQEIPMDAAPAQAVRATPDSPIVRAMRDQRAGEVDAVVSAGSTGAMVAASLLILGRLPAAERPAIATFFPTVRGETLLLDAGANTQTTAELLLSFARMGDAYCRAMHHVASPAVGLLNIGSEPAKGNDLAVQTHQALRGSELNFVGNVEGNEVMVGECDVLITDGFTGNIVLKFVEGVAQFLNALARSGRLEPQELEGLKAFSVAIKRRFNYEIYGGAPLLGVAGVSIICHGRSSALAFTHAIRVADQQVRCRLPDLIAGALSGPAGREG